MDIARASIDRPVNTWLIILACLLGGWWGLNGIGRLEDPAFTIKMALVITPYPGATAAEVEEEITEPLESAIQQLPQLKRLTSRSRPGESIIKVEIKNTYDGNTIPQVWDELRRKVGDAQSSLPPSARRSIVYDDYGDVFGIFYAVTAPGFSDAEIRELSRFLRRELLTVPNVAKVSTAGEPEETIYVEISEERLVSLGLPLEAVLNTIQTENRVQDGGAITVDGRRLRFSAPPGFDSVASIEALRIGRPGSTEQISLLDVATVYRGTTDTPDHLIIHNGEAAFTLAVAGLQDANIVEVGKAVSAHLQRLQGNIPLGVDIHPVYEQHVVVEQAINSFLISLLLSVSIVIGVLCLTMGWRVGVVVGVTLLLTVLGTVFFMRMLSIEMERISLGALIIAMGMLVDNAIVIAEGMLIGIQRGQLARDAASDASRRTQMPLLGATVIGIMAFSGIGLSSDITGEFLFSLFAVIAISLMLSWLLAITVTPLMGHYLFDGHQYQEGEDPYNQPVYLRYREMLVRVLRHRGRTVMVLVAVTLLAVVGFGFLKHAFFPPSNTPMFYLNVLLRQGSDIQETAQRLREMDAVLREHEEVEAVTGFIGQGASRFMLTYEPELPNPSYGQLIVRVSDRDRIDDLVVALRQRFALQFPGVEVYPQRLMFGPGGGAKIEARFKGHDPVVLRQLGEQARAVFARSGVVVDVRTDWRQQEMVIVPRFDEERARIAGVGRSEIATSSLFASTGVRAGTYRERDSQIPIIVRPPYQERTNVSRLSDRLMWSSAEQAYVPVSQVVSGFDIATEESLIHRRNRVRALKVQADPAGDLTADQALRRLRPLVEYIPLPPGYVLEWGGEFEGAQEAQASLAREVPLGFLVMLVISVLLFGSVRQPLVIWLVVPMSICGVSAGLLLTGQPFTFMALLGFLSLSGMLMKNAIVLVDEIDTQAREGKPPPEALLDASVSRLRPVFLAAFTTILGMIPLLWDAFFASMAITIMAGLAFATLLTMVAAPVLYALLFRIRLAP
ncbi:MAG: efflux RND transporter permease subunit [Alcanivoracaceae bacterium]